jgi:hypothetical protein
MTIETQDNKLLSPKTGALSVLSYSPFTFSLKNPLTL